MARSFATLNSCRQLQETQRGRRQLWTSFYAAIVAGSKYTEAVSGEPAWDEQHQQAHNELKHWSAITWNKM
jgi:hypothetical protein